MMNLFQNTQSKTSTFMISPGMEVMGGLEGDCSGRIEGQVHGNVKIRGKVIVDLGGHVDGHLIGEVLVVNGKVDGDVVGSRSVELGPNASVSGDIISYSIQINPTAHVSGKLLKKDAIIDLDKFDPTKQVEDRSVVNGRVVKIVKPEKTTAFSQEYQNAAGDSWW